MKSIVLMCLFLVSTFPIYKNPISMGGVLVLISVSLALFMSLMSSWWYSYVLFLVYIGGLLVMFIYVSMITSNYPFFFDLNQLLVFMIISLGLNFFVSIKPLSLRSLGSQVFDSGSVLVSQGNLSLFIGMAVLLLVMLLVVVRSVGAGMVNVN